jgi:hypothetical protein
VRYVICLRNPLDVARSLERRNDFPPEKAVKLWLAYVEVSLEHTAAQERIFVLYEDVMDNWRQELQRLGSFLGQPHRADQGDVQRAVEDFIDQDLRHHLTSVGDTVDESSIDLQVEGLSGARRLYVALRWDKCQEHRDGNVTIEAANGGP